MKAEEMQETTNVSENFEDVMERRIERRTFLKGAMVAAVGASALGGAVEVLAQKGDDFVAADIPAEFSADGVNPLTFQPISLDRTDAITVPPSYNSQVIIRWGDPVVPGATAIDYNNQTGASQAGQFGYNCDFVTIFPLPATDELSKGEETNDGGGTPITRALLAVNHEYTNPELMFPGYVAGTPTADQVAAEIAAHGLSVVEIVLGTNGWQYVPSSTFNRRITGQTPMELTGPAAGDDMLKTSTDTTGRNALGMFNNCGGGWTPWGTILTAEENFNQYFGNLNGLPTTDSRRAMHARYGLPLNASERRWENFQTRFNVGTEPNEAFRFGYIVEIDPYNPNFLPKKRTALGRFKHEAATTAVSADNRVVCYMGDDERFDYMYKFVSAGTISPNRTENFNLLDTGTLYIAKFNDDGTGEWLPMIAGQGPLASWTAAQVAYNTRGAADLMGATKMDRPEDVERNPFNGKVYAAFTNNTLRGAGSNPPPNAANPRAVNRNGHIIEILESNNNAAATTFTWEITMLCGNPRRPADQTYFAGVQQQASRFLVSPISCPDNIGFDTSGNLWIATDGMPGNLPGNDAIFAVATQGSEKGQVKQFLSSVVGCETAGLFISQDDRTLFVTIQHPAEGSTFAAPTSRFPDYNTNPPRPSVVAIRKTSGSPIIGS